MYLYAQLVKEIRKGSEEKNSASTRHGHDRHRNCGAQDDGNSMDQSSGTISSHRSHGSVRNPTLLNPQPVPINCLRQNCNIPSATSFICCFCFSCCVLLLVPCVRPLLCRRPVCMSFVGEREYSFSLLSSVTVTLKQLKLLTSSLTHQILCHASLFLFLSHQQPSP